MRKLEDVVRSLTESIVFELGVHAGRTGDAVDAATVRAVCTAALRKALPVELELQRSETLLRGTISKHGVITVTADTQVVKIVSPDGTLQLFPCEHCGECHWVALNVVSHLCDRCALLWATNEFPDVTIPAEAATRETR